MRTSPISFLQQKVEAAAPPGPTFPLTSQAVHRFEEVYTNQATSTTITDLVTGNDNLELNGTVSVNSSQYIDVTGNTTNSSGARTSYARLNINSTVSGNRDVYSFIILEEYQDNSVYTSGNLYLADFRSLNNWFGSFMTDASSLASKFVGTGGEQFVYVPGNAVYNATTSTSTFSDGTGTIGGGDDYYQWIGNSPASRGATGFRRLWGFNIPTANVFNTNTNGGPTNSIRLFSSYTGQEASNVKIWAVCLFDTHLTTTTFNQLITYYQSLGYIT